MHPTAYTPGEPVSRTRYLRGLLSPVARLHLPSRQVGAATLVLVLSIIAFTVHTGWQNYERTLARTDRDTRNVARLLAEHAAQTFDGVAEVMRAVGRLREDAVRGIYRSQSSIYVHLQTLQGGSPVLTEVGWFDGYGERVATSRELDPPRISAADRELFQAVQDRPGYRLHVSAPEMRPDPDGDDRSPIPVSLRLDALDGSFAGVAAGMIDPESFAKLFRSLDLGPGYAITLLRRDGVVLAYAINEGGVSPGGHRHFPEDLRRAESGTYRTDGSIDGVPRLASFVSVPRSDGQLLIDVAVTRSDAFAPFRRALAINVLESFFALAVLLVGARLLVHGLRRREELQEALATTTEHAKSARAEAEAANRAKSEFLARMSHELRTPLNAVIGFGQMLGLDRTGPLSDRQKEYTGYIVQSGEHLLELINEVLDFAGVESGRVSVSLERIAVAEMLQSVGRLMLPVATKAGIRLEIADAGEVPDVRADPLRLRQILINLVANAIKYNRPAGNVVLWAEAGSTGRVRFAVSDTGFGIPFSRRSGLFQPFERLGAEHTGVEGTGLGLALSKRLVEALGGEIGFATEVGEGSTFWVDLPVGEVLQAMPKASVATPAVFPSVTSEAFKLLYVEDNPSNLRLMESLIATLPHATMLSAPTPIIALDLAAAHRPDVIILDLHLPRMSGYDVLERLKSMPETRETPVLALSAAALADDSERGLSAGFFRYLTKPIDVNAVLAGIGAALTEARRRQETETEAVHSTRNLGR